MKHAPQPLYLLADSQLLFWRDGGGLFLDEVRRRIARARPRAAYVGASNGDAPEFYSIFEAAMHGVGVSDCRMIRSAFTAEDKSFLSEADIILLAGGDVERGWRVFTETGMGEVIVRRYKEGAVLIGVSAGAVQLGLCASGDAGAAPADVLKTFGLVPFVIDAHDEGRGWAALRSAVRSQSGAARGFGVPTGGGLVYHPDGRVEAVRRPLFECRCEGGDIVSTTLPPPG